MPLSLLSVPIQNWLAYLSQQRRLSKHTVIAYQRDVRHFLTFMKVHRESNIDMHTLESLTLRDCRAWLASRHRDFEAKSNARAVASVKNFWRHLIKHHYIKNDVFSLLTAPKIKKTLPRPLTHSQTNTLLDHINSVPTIAWVGLRDRALVMLLYGTGLRISEALSLTRTQLASDVFIIRGKGNKERQIPLLKEVRFSVMKYIEACPYHGHDLPLFLGIRGKVLHTSAAALVLRTFRRMYNLPETLTPHALRHTCASHLMNASSDLRGIQTLLGHASLSSTQVYTALDTQKLLETYKKAHPRR
ncbi:MAG: tyrosine recombinase XerC [Alphaproteobacteria bacterium]|nr:tyrosine recombinase XerC [Alphaproteobacteria bacterium]